MAHIIVHNPGFLTTIQDEGRLGRAHLGISASGAADRLALRIGNAVVGNSNRAAALEMTLVGGTFEFDSVTTIALTGSAFDASLNEMPLDFWKAFDVEAGSVLKIDSTLSGARCYLCIRGGVDVPRFLASSSTHIFTGTGGYEGRPLRKGDMLRIGTDVGSKPLMNRLPEQLIESLYKRQPLRITWGPQRDFFADDALRLFLTSPFRVLENSNRMGLRLSGPAIPRKSVELLTEGVPLGAIQIPQDGQPIILFVEHQTTGGYPKIANVIAADIHRVGQLRPRDEVRFELVPFKKAKQILLDQESLLQQQLENRQ